MVKNNRMSANIKEAELCIGAYCKRDSKPGKKYWVPTFYFLWKLSVSDLIIIKLIHCHINSRSPFKAILLKSTGETTWILIYT